MASLGVNSLFTNIPLKETIDICVDNLYKDNDNTLNIFRENEKFATNVYRKKTFSGLYTNFKSFIPETYKIGLVK